ncbi:LCP family protein [Streptomyces sp. A13(2022)]|uniref:LCP family protein n=1 Tax=Streptomyces sp. A13(2022) TaxID=2964768 RepID=UPI0021D809DB|nr:LCP family protein [Streptomyces sp. A13(2022)]MCU8593677.1 LCP family protein [Streptomyces sp. A13(2022)]
MTTPDQQATPERRVGHRRSGRRRRRGRLRPALAISLSLIVLVTAGAGWLYLRLTGNIDTFSADGISDDRPDAAASKGENVLVIGSDARTGGNSDLGGGDKGDIGRSDTAFLLHVYADHRHAVAVSIPRDTLVTIPPCRLPDGTWTEEQSDTMFNAAYSVGQTPEGNPACTQNTVEKLSGLRVDHTVVVDFKGFASLTDVVGGVEVCLPQDLYQRDLNPNRAARGKKLFDKGKQNVSGQRALDYVRIRHGIGDGSDIGRIKRQQAFMSGLLKKIKDDGFTPTKLLPLAEAATDALTVDPGLGSADKLLKFAMSLKDVDLHNTRFVTIPWRYEGSRVAVVEPDAGDLWASLKDDRAPADADADKDGDEDGGKSGGEDGAGDEDKGGSEVSGQGVDVAVRNGTGTTGLAARAAGTLEESGFTVTGTGNADRTDHATTVIQYGPGRKDDAEKLAGLFPDAGLESVGQDGNEEGREEGLVLVLGDDYTGEASGARGGGASGAPAEDARTADADPCSDLSYG